MLNLIRMNLYRMMHTRSLQIVWLVMLAFMMVNAYMTLRERDTYTAEEMEEIHEQQTQGFVVSDEGDIQMIFGISVNPIVTEDGFDVSALGFLASDMGSGVILVFMVIATALFFTGEEKHGFVKNIAGQTGHKWSIYFSKLIVMIMYLAASLVLCLLADILGIALFSGNVSLTEGRLADYMASIGTLALLYIAFISGVALLATVTKSNAMSISAGILLTMGVSKMLARLFYMVTKCDIGEYIVMGNVSSVFVGASEQAFYTAAAVGICYIIVYNLVGSLWFTKRDVV